MFCSQCGKSCIPNAKFCHNCGRNVSCSNAAEVQRTSSDSSSPSTSNSSTGSSNIRPITFAEFRSRKEIDRSSHFKGKNLKRLKSHGKSAKTSEVKINIGIMTKREDALVIKRGVSLPISVSTAVNYDNLLKKSVEKHHRFNKDLIKHDDQKLYHLLYSDKKKATTLPGSEEPFTLKRYKEEIDKPYSRITFYLCSCSDYLSSIFNDIPTDSDSDLESMNQITETQEKGDFNHVASSSHSSIPVDVPEPNNEVVVAQPHRSMEAQCPICFFLFPVHQIEEHADSCSSFFTVESEDDPLPNSPPREIQEETGPLDVVSGSHTSCSKSLLKEQIKSCSANLSPDLTRINVRRRNLWEDFKNARRKKINPLSNLKIVFLGEPSMDDGGPKREFFCELLTAIQRIFFCEGCPVSSTTAICNEDFKLCGEVMMMSVMQGGPAPNFLAPSLASYVVGKPLASTNIKNPLYKSACESLHNARSDDEVRQVLTSDELLDILQEIGYRGIPQRETVACVGSIVQSICVKDQLSKYLPALLQIVHGIEATGFLDVIRKSPEIWEPVFAIGNSFEITPDEFLDQLVPHYSESQVKRIAEVDTYKYFCDVVEAEEGPTFKVRDLLKWLTGSYQLPPLGFPKPFSVQFVHGCRNGCACRPTASTCDITINFPVHIKDEVTMKEMIGSAINDSHGFDLI